MLEQVLSHFSRADELPDVHRQRSLFNAFEARPHLARWPAGHFFISMPFEAVAPKRLLGVSPNRFPRDDEPAQPTGLASY